LARIEHEYSRCGTHVGVAGRREPAVKQLRKVRGSKQHMVEKAVQFSLRVQVGLLAKKYFPKMKKVPSLLVIQDTNNDERGPAWLNALTGTIYIDERISAFQEKTTKILILHELMHWSLFESNGDPDEQEGKRFQAELSRIKGLGAYTGLL
jgi:hypothetical protein